VQEVALYGLLEARPRGPAGQFVDLDGGVEAEELGLEVLVVLALGTQFVGGVDDGLLVDPDAGVAVVLEGLDNRQQRGRAVESREGVVAAVDDPGPVSDGLDGTADVVAVGVVAVVMDQQPGEPVENGLHEIPDALLCPESPVVLDAQDDVLTGDVDDLAHFPHVIAVRVLGPRGEADGRLQDPAGALHLLEDGNHVPDVIEEVEDAEHVDHLGEMLDRQADDVVRVGPIPEEVDPPDQRLKQGLGHHGLEDPQLLEGIDLLSQHVHVDRGPAGDLDGKIAAGVSLPGHEHLRVGQHPVLEIRLGEVPLGVGHVVALRPADLVQDVSNPVLLELPRGDSLVDRV